jgi:V-type H+-transporting ATPase subunit a
MLIYMFLTPGTVDDSVKLYPGQGVVQSILLLIAFVCIPWLLCAKPYLQWKEIKRIQEQGYQGLSRGDDLPRASTDALLENEEEGNGRAVAEDMGEVHVC